MPRSRSSRDTSRRDNSMSSAALALLIGGYIANWSTSLTRYFLVDNDSGDDTNRGYIDAAAGSTLSPSGVAIKTVAKLYSIFPTVGAGRTCVILLKGKTSGTYLDSSGVATSLLLRGIGGYNRLVIRGSTDLTNNAADRLTCGGRTATGFNAAGYNITVNTKTIIAVTNATPVAIQTSAAHGLTTGDQVQIASVGGQPSANGEYTVTVTGLDTFTLDNTRATPIEAYTAGGTVTSYGFALVGGGAPAFPAVASCRGYRLRFDAATATASLRNTCYEIFRLGGASVIPGRAFAAAPAGTDVVYVEEAGAAFTDVQYQGQESASVSALGSTGAITFEGTDGIPVPTSLSTGGFIASFCQAVTTMGLYGPFAQAFLANQYFDETNTAVTNGGNRAREYNARGIGLFSFFRCQAFGTSAPNSFVNIGTFSSCHTNFSARGFDVLGCGNGVGLVISANFTTGAIGKGTASTSKRNVFGGSAHNGSINLVRSSVSLYGNFFDASTATPINIEGVGCSVAIDDCIGSSSADVPGINCDTSARFCNLSIGVNAPCSAAGSASKQVQVSGAVQVTYATLASTNPVTDAKQNRVAGISPFTALVIV